MLLALCSSGAIAEWREVGGNEAAATYADSDMTPHTGPVVRMWHLVDYGSARAIEGIKPYRSVTMQSDYDCAHGRRRTVQIALHSGNMGTGAVLGRVTYPEDWRPVRPDTLVETLWGHACGNS
jgi:hypothetical protein